MITGIYLQQIVIYSRKGLDANVCSAALFRLHARNPTGKGSVFHGDVPPALPPHLQLIYKERHV